MANVWITAEGEASTSVEIPGQDAMWLAAKLRQLDNIDEATEVAAAIEAAVEDESDCEVALIVTQLAAMQTALDVVDAHSSEAFAQLRAELARWAT